MGLKDKIGKGLKKISVYKDTQDKRNQERAKKRIKMMRLETKNLKIEHAYLKQRAAVDSFKFKEEEKKKEKLKKLNELLGGGIR